MSTATHPLQNAPIAEWTMTAFFLAFVACLCLALGLFEAGLSIPVTLDTLEVTSTTMAVVMAATVSMVFALVSVPLVIVFA